MARESNAQLFPPDHSAHHGANDSSNGPPSKYNGESSRKGLEDELKSLESHGAQGITEASFRDNEFQPPTSSQTPRIELPAPGDPQRNCVRPSSQHTGHPVGNLGLQVPPPGSASESGRSGRSDWTQLSFHSIKKVKDRGAEAHITWEQSVGTTGPPCEPPGNGTSMMGHLDVQSIANQICGSFEESEFDKKSYLPLDRLSEILAPGVVRTLLLEHFDERTTDEFKAEILGTGLCDGPSRPRRRRIFAILILVEQIRRLGEFIDAKVDDSNLPLSFERRKGPTRKVYYTHRDPEEPPCSFTEWPSRIAENFRNYQQTIHVPFFKLPGDEVAFYDLQHDSTLPFCRHEEPKSGGYGSVRKVSIHHAHHYRGNRPEDKKPLECAVKRLHVPNQDAYLKEVEIFDKLHVGKEKGGDLSNHLISLQLTYRLGQDFYLVFPWADGNLKEFWGKQTADPSSSAYGLWFFDQCWGIARGLRKIHHLGTNSIKRAKETLLDAENGPKMVLAQLQDDNQWGRHGDIKPENILWFKDHHGRRDHLVISDFGLTQFNSANSRSKVLQDKIQGFSGTYRPPDLHLEGEISQRYDVWSLGCVLLEFTSWFLLGYGPTVGDFLKQRLNDRHEKKTAREDKFFSLIEGTGEKKGKNAAEVKDSVVEWIKKLHRHEYCTEPLHALLDLIQFTMLVPNSRHRWDCDQIRNELGNLHQLCPKHGAVVEGVPMRPNPRRYAPRDAAAEQGENYRTQSRRVSDAELQDDQANLTSEEESGRKVPSFVHGNTDDTLLETSQGNVSTQTPYTSREATQQEVDNLGTGAQFDTTLDKRGQYEDASALSVRLTNSRVSNGPGSSPEGSHRQLVAETLPAAASRDDEPSTYASRPGNSRKPDPGLETQVSRGTNTMQPAEPGPPGRGRIGERVLSWMTKMLCSR